MGWSIGVTYSIAYAAQHPELVSGLVLLDYPARYPKFSAGWAERWSSEPSVKDNPDRMRGMRGLERESKEIQLWDKLDAIKSPILLIGGGAEGALLKQEHIEKYRQHSRNMVSRNLSRLWTHGLAARLQQVHQQTKQVPQLHRRPA